MKNKKKKFITLGMVFALGAMSMVGLTACGNSRDGDSQYAQDFYAMSAISSFNYLQGLGNDMAINNTTETSTSTSIQEADEQNIVEYMGMFKGMLASETTDYYDNGIVPADDTYAEQFSYVMTLNVPAINGEPAQSFKMYYNEYYLSTESSDQQEIDDDDFELEINTRIQGILISGENMYAVTGEREYEQEGNETEVEIWFRASIDTSNYIIVEHEMEAGEYEYQYTLVNDGQVSTTEVEFENERGNKSLELEFETTTQTSQDKVKYEITQISENEFNVKVKYASNNTETGESFKIIATADGYQFVYSEQTSEVV